MLKNTELQDAAFEWMKGLPKGKTFDNNDLYCFLKQNFSEECSRRGEAASEPRYKNDARWAVQCAKRENLVKDTGIRGRFQRL
jgi:hypothetical protein